MDNAEFIAALKEERQRICESVNSLRRLIDQLRIDMALRIDTTSNMPPPGH